MFKGVMGSGSVYFYDFFLFVFWHSVTYSKLLQFIWF